MKSPAMMPLRSVMTALRTRRGSVQVGGSLYALCSIGCFKLLTACRAFLLRTCNPIA